MDILTGPKPALALPLASALHAYKRAQAVGKEAGQDLLSTKPQVRVVPETEGSSYKISDGKLKKKPHSTSITPCCAMWPFPNDLAPHGNPGQSFA